MTSSSCLEWMAWAAHREFHEEASSFRVEASARPGLAAAASFSSLGMASRNALIVKAAWVGACVWMRTREREKEGRRGE